MPILAVPPLAQLRDEFRLSMRRLWQELCRELRADYAALASQFALPVDFLQQPQAVHGVDKGNEGCDILNLVALKVANHVPFDISGQNRMLRLHFLRLVFTKDALTGTIGFLKTFNRLGLAYGNQAAAGSLQFFLQRGDVGGYHPIFALFSE